MPNTIALMSKFASMLDEVYAVGSRTAILDASADVLKNVSATIPRETAFTFLSDFSRSFA